jgi:hypothetical protein
VRELDEARQKLERREREAREAQAAAKAAEAQAAAEAANKVRDSGCGAAEGFLLRWWLAALAFHHSSACHRIAQPIFPAPPCPPCLQVHAAEVAQKKAESDLVQMRAREAALQIQVEAANKSAEAAAGEAAAGAAAAAEERRQREAAEDRAGRAEAELAAVQEALAGKEAAVEAARAEVEGLRRSLEAGGREHAELAAELEAAQAAAQQKQGEVRGAWLHRSPLCPFHCCFACRACCWQVCDAGGSLSTRFPV